MEAISWIRTFIRSSVYPIVSLVNDIKLTDTECFSVAKDFPFTYEDIRNAFPVKLGEHDRIIKHFQPSLLL